MDNLEGIFLHLSVLLLHVLQIACESVVSNPVVTTDKGRVRGQRLNIHGKLVDAYYGIPYAEPPIGDRRFKPPVQKDPWTRDVDGTVKPNACMQGIDQQFPNFTGAEVWNANTRRDEDCLYLNVWTPRNNPPYTNKAVMVWIFGGGFYSGSSSLDIYDAKYLAAENDVVVVSMQYRVGALGFFSMFHKEAPGNAGLLDQVMALDWVQNNIHNFGGNNHNITLFGESAGAVSVGMHLLSPLSRGKFHRAILQSGAPHAGWAVMSEEEGKRRGMALAKRLGCDTPEPSEMIRCLRTKDANRFWEEEFYVFEYRVVGFPFVPIVDGVFLTETPQKSIETNNFKKCPLLMGNTLNEASYWLAYYRKDIFRRNDEALVSRLLFNNLINDIFKWHPNYPIELNSFGIDAIKFQYTHWQNRDDQEQNRYNIDMAAGDYHFICPTVDFAQAYASSGNNVYYYVFTHRSSVHYWAEWMGVMHADEINFVFGEPLDHSKGYTHPERKFASKMMKYWTNFAKTGDPNREPGELSLNEWPVYQNTTQQYLTLDANYFTHTREHISKAINTGPRIKECAFWKHYLPELVVATADITEMEREWKVQFNAWSTKYIVDWKYQFDKFITNHEKRTQNCVP